MTVTVLTLDCVCIDVLCEFTRYTYLRTYEHWMTAGH